MATTRASAIRPSVCGSTGAGTDIGQRIHNVQLQLDSLLQQLNDVRRAWLSGELLEGPSADPQGAFLVAAGAGETLIPHGLGRKVRGWIVTEKSTQGVVWRDVDSANDNETFLVLHATVDVSVKLVVF